MTDETYRTVRRPARVSLTVRGSTFIGHVSPVDTIADAEMFVAGIKEANPEATHNVPAYRVRSDPFREWSSDEGEPTGSAGKPALKVLQGQHLENTAVVVTRHYGGTDLGIGGLVRSYTRAVTGAIDAAGIVEQQPLARFSITIEYTDSGTVRGILESAGVDFDATYSEHISFDVRVPVATADQLRDRLRSATSGRVTIG